MAMGSPALMALVEVLTAFTGGTSLQVGLQSSPDNSTYTTAASGPVVAEANLVAVAFLLAIDLPRPSPGLAFPRYSRLIYVSVGTHGAGALFGALVLNRPDQMVTAPGAPTVYPAGQTVAN